MKKAFNIISIFILLITMFSGAFFVEETEVVEAANENYTSCYDYNTGSYKNYEGCQTNVSGYGSIKITNEGSIKVEYNSSYGISDLIIYAMECQSYKKEGLEYKVDDEYGRRTCTGGYGANRKIFYVSGSKYKKANINGEEKISNSRTIHLFNYYGYGALVNIYVRVKFVKTDNLTSNSDVTQVKERIYESTPTGTDAFKKFSFECGDECGTGKTAGEIIYIDKSPMYYTDNLSNSEFSTVGKDNIVLSIDNTTVSGASEEVNNIIYDTVIPALMIVLAIAAVVTLSVLGYEIVKDSDDSQGRHEKIVRIRNILIGLIAAFVMLFAIEPIIKFIEGFLE